MSFQIREGHVLTRLREMPEASVDCCVTSPPFWGLRDYGTEPQVWDGTDADCSHEWGSEQFRRGPAGAQGSTSQRVGRTNAEEQTSAGKPPKDVGANCAALGAGSSAWSPHPNSTCSTPLRSSASFGASFPRRVRCGLTSAIASQPAPAPLVSVQVEARKDPDGRDSILEE